MGGAVARSLFQISGDGDRPINNLGEIGSNQPVTYSVTKNKYRSKSYLMNSAHRYVVFYKVLRMTHFTSNRGDH